MLCAGCVAILTGLHEGFSNLDARRNKFLRHKTREGVQSAAANGCRICGFIFTNAESRDDWKSVYIRPTGLGRGVDFSCSESEETLTTVTWPEWRIYSRKLYGLQPPSTYPKYLAQVAQDVSDGALSTVRDDGFSRRSVPSSTGDDEAVAVARAWLDRCLEMHKHCGGTNDPVTSDSGDSQPQWQPKRLVDVTAPGNRLKLVQRDKDVVSGPYAALSHCWGFSDFFKLTEENYDAIVDGQTLIDELPKSFREAIHFCRRLEIRYLWIDSLCILQSGPGSEEDWLAHTTEMQLVYSKCVLNIAINCSTSPHQGAYRDRLPALLTKTYTPYEPKEGGVPGDFSNYIWSLITFEDDYSQKAREGPLATRGWVVQERFLSPRILSFGHDRLSWECNECRTNECCPPEYMEALEHTGLDGTDDDIDHEVPFTVLPSATFAVSQELAQMDPRSNAYLMKCTSEWLRIVQQFAACKLTYPDKDKATALAGVAQKIGALTPSSTYAAGLFSHNLPFGLLWRVRDPWGTLARGVVSRSRAPSWSWLNTNSAVYYSIGAHTEYQNPCWNFFSHEQQYVEDIELDAQSGAIRLRGWVLTKNIVEEAYGGWGSLRYYSDHFTRDWKEDWVMLPLGKYTGIDTLEGGLILQTTKTPGQLRRVGTWEKYGAPQWAFIPEPPDIEELWTYEKVAITIV